MTELVVAASAKKTFVWIEFVEFWVILLSYDNIKTIASKMRMEGAHDRKKWKILKEAYILQWMDNCWGRRRKRGQV